LSGKYLGPADVTLVVVWLHRPEVSATLDVLVVGANPIDSERGSTLLEAIKTSNLKIIDIGKPLPISEPYESGMSDLSEIGM
jgi:hypothetical protein